MENKFKERAKKAQENKNALIETIIDDLENNLLKNNLYDFRYYIFDLCREALSKRTQKELKEINS
jgi:hypothetical protein